MIVTDNHVSFKGQVSFEAKNSELTKSFRNGQFSTNDVSNDAGNNDIFQKVQV